MQTDDEPDLERLEEGHEVTVYYNSTRSGNEVSRTGTVASTHVVEEGRLARVHVETRGRFKEQYVAVAELSEDQPVLAFSMTAEATHDLDDPPKIGRAYALKFEVTRRSLLGKVDRIVREDGPGPFLVT